MQTFLYVLGPFILQCGGALGMTLIGAAIGHAVFKRTNAAVQLQNAQRDAIEDLRSWAHDADCLIDELVVKNSMNKVLSEALGDELSEQLIDLNFQSPAKQLERAKPRRRAITER